MIYTNWAGHKDLTVSRLGFGTTRFNIADLKDEAGLNRCVELVLHAIERGINYFDVAPTYSFGQAEKILGRAFAQVKNPVHVACKSGLTIDKTSEDILRRVEVSIKTLNVDCIDIYQIWSIMNLEEYQTALQPKGIYEGVVEAKERGYVKHICASLHCTPSEAEKIISDGYFEGILISMNAINYEQWLPVIKLAKEKNIAVATMNSLGGGLIPQYPNLFKNLDSTEDSVAIKALRFLQSFEEITVILSGMRTIQEIDDNASAFDSVKKSSTNFKLDTVDKLCSGCNYCAPCTVGIPISACMQAYNHKILVESSCTNTDEKILANEIFIRTRANGVNFTTLKNCISCKKCESRCTQKIKISERMQELSKLAKKFHYTNEDIQKRLKEIDAELLSAKHIGIYPACDYAQRLFEIWNNPELQSRCEFFNSSPSMWDKTFLGKPIHSPEEILKLDIDAILITHYSFQDEIYDSLKDLSSNIKIIKLHKAGDINWFNQAAGK